MQIEITGFEDINEHGFHQSAQQQLIRAFGSLSANILHIKAALSDEDIQLGGTNHRCRVFVQTTRSEHVFSEAYDSFPIAAVIRAAERARRILLAKIYRPRLRRF